MLAPAFRKSGKTSWKANLVPIDGVGRGDGLVEASSSASSFRVQSDQVYTEICGGRECDANSSGLKLLALISVSCNEV